MVMELQKSRLRLQLFVRWVCQRRQANKIKKKALHMVSPSKRKMSEQEEGSNNWIKQKLS